MKRPRLKSVALVLVCALAVSGLAATRAYFVEPKECNTGWTPEDEYVGNTFVANVDSIAYIEWFCAEPSAEGLDMPLASA